VIFPPGRAKLATSPDRTGSPTIITMGIVVVASLAAWAAAALVTWSSLHLRKLGDREEEAPWPSISSRSLCSS